MQRLIFGCIALFVYACSSGDAAPPVATAVVEKEINDSSQIELNTPLDPVDTSLLEELNLADVQSINPAIFVDLKYAGSENFMKMKLYDKFEKAYLLKDVAIRLGKVQELLAAKDSNLHLLIYDALRPVSVQRKMWRALDSIPPKRRGLYVSNPANGSVHNFGAAVDLTICTSDGIPLDMGAGFDDFREIAYPSKESHFLETGELSKQQVANRRLLRTVMQGQGFTNIPSEWWHFNGISRKDLVGKYTALQEEF